MTRRGWSPWAVACLLVAVGAPGMSQGRLAWNEAPAVGSWAEFELTIEKDGKVSTGTYRLSALKRTRVDGANHLWCELVRQKGSKTRIFKLLLPEDEVARSSRPLSVAREVVYQDQGKSALRAEGATLSSLVSILEAMEGEGPLTYESLGRETIELSDGSKVEGFRKRGETVLSLPGGDETRVESEVWVSKSIPFGVVKQVVTTTRGEGVTAERKVETLLLSGHGPTGASSRITGPIKPFSLLDLLVGD